MKGICTNEYELNAWDNDQLIIGMDEAGRGPLAGPLVVAGVVFPKGYHNDAIYDSKALTEKKREQLFQQILHDAVFTSICIKTNEDIDHSNIYALTQQTMALIRNQYPNALALTDAMPLPMCDNVTSLIKGDQKSISIAAASILAKVTRDHMMVLYDLVYPQYQFKKNKGYGTKAHMQAIDEYGICPIHRTSYGPCSVRQMKLF